MKSAESSSGNQSRREEAQRVRRARRAGHGGRDHAGHDHGTHPDADGRLLGIALALILAFMVVEIVVAFLSQSLALIADAGHMLTDAAAVGAAIWTVRMSRRPATVDMTFGYRRAEVLSAALNGVALIAIGAVILVEAVHRLMHPAAVHGTPMVVVAVIGVVVNVAATMSVGRANLARLDIAGAFAHLVTDIWAFAGTLVAGVVIIVTGVGRADSIASLLVVALMGRAAWPLLRSAGRILLEATPEGVDLEAVRRHILELPEVTAVHDLHAWVVSSDLPAVSAHIVVSEACFASGSAPRLLDELQSCLAGHFDVGHSTFQLEATGHIDHESAFHA